ARGEDLLLRRPALALEEATGDLARGERLLLVVAGEREEIDALSRGREGCGGDEDDGLTELDECGAAGLLRHAAGLDRQGTAVEVDLDSLVSGLRHASLLGGHRAAHLDSRRARRRRGGKKAGAYFRIPNRSMRVL